MNYLQFKKQLHSFEIFSLSDIKKIDSKFHSRRLVEWQDKGYIKKIINRWYVFSDVKISENLLFYISNKIYSPSYISFETALSYYNLIPEGVYTITSATSLKTNEFKTEVGNFNYKHLKPSLLFGYRIVEIGNHKITIADIEKTIIDYLYINEKINTDKHFEGLRMNKEILFSKFSIRKMNTYLKVYNNKALSKRVNDFIKFMKND